MEEVKTQAEQHEEVADLIMGETEADLEVAPTPDPEIPEDAEEAPEVEAKADDEVEAPTDEMVEVEWDGQLIEAPKAVAEALMRNSDYTQKTQQIAAKGKEFEVLISDANKKLEQFKFAESIQPDVMKAQQLEATAEQYHEYLRENLDTISSTDIEKIRFTIEDTRRQRDELVQSLQVKQGEFQQSQEQAHAELLNQGTEVLRQKIPGWGKEQQEQVRSYAVSSGFTEAELNGVVDPRQVEALWKAAQYDALKAGAAPAVQKVQQAPTIKTKARESMPKETRAKLDLRNKLKSTKLSARDKQNLVAKDLGERWG